MLNKFKMQSIKEVFASITEANKEKVQKTEAQKEALACKFELLTEAQKILLSSYELAQMQKTSVQATINLLSLELVKYVTANDAKSMKEVAKRITDSQALLVSLNEVKKQNTSTNKMRVNNLNSAVTEYIFSQDSFANCDYGDLCDFLDSKKVAYTVANSKYIYSTCLNTVQLYCELTAHANSLQTEANANAKK